VERVSLTIEHNSGWENPIMQDQGLFIGLDTVLMSICTLLQTFVHPGIFFLFVRESATLHSKTDSEHSAHPLRQV
jgi:hypothetical protein